MIQFSFSDIKRRSFRNAFQCNCYYISCLFYLIFKFITIKRGKTY